MMPFFAASFPPNIQTCLGRPSFFLVIQASLLEKFLLLFSFLPLPLILSPLLPEPFPSSSYWQALSWQTSAFGWWLVEVESSTKMRRSRCIPCCLLPLLTSPSVIFAAQLKTAVGLS